MTLQGCYIALKKDMFKFPQAHYPLKEREKLSFENIRSVRPRFGLPPKFLKQVLGVRAKQDLKKGIPLDLDFIE